MSKLSLQQISELSAKLTVPGTEKTFEPEEGVLYMDMVRAANKDLQQTKFYVTVTLAAGDEYKLTLYSR